MEINDDSEANVGGKRMVDDSEMEKRKKTVAVTTTTATKIVQHNISFEKASNAGFVIKQFSMGMYALSQSNVLEGDLQRVWSEIYERREREREEKSEGKNGTDDTFNTWYF